MADTKRERTVIQVIVAIIALLAIVALLAWARGEPGVGGRAPDPKDAAGIEQLLTEVG